MIARHHISVIKACLGHCLYSTFLFQPLLLDCLSQKKPPLFFIEKADNKMERYKGMYGNV